MVVTHARGKRRRERVKDSLSETTLTHKIALLGISMHCFQKKYYQHVRNAVLDVCAKSVPVWGKSEEMRGLLRGVTLS